MFRYIVDKLSTCGCCLLCERLTQSAVTSCASEPVVPTLFFSVVGEFMATHALRKLHISKANPTDQRVLASRALFDWLEKGGPQPVSQPRAPDAPPLVHLSGMFELSGTESNVTLVAKRSVERANHFVTATAQISIMHPRSDAVSPQRQRAVAELAQKVRLWRTGGAGLLGDADDAYRIDLVLLLAIELLEGTRSKWAPYLASLPKVEDAAPPSLWPYLLGSVAASGAAATKLLREHTVLGPQLAVDALELAPLFAQGTPPAGSDAAMAKGQEVLEGVAAQVSGTTISGARAALLRSLALVSSRMIGGAGLVPLLDLCNGAVSGGGHNATIEKTQLAISNEAPEAAPCTAVLTSQRIEKGDELLLAYGTYSAAKFLYTYGWAMGGPDEPSAVSSPHDMVVVVPRGLWPSLSEAQRRVLAKYKFTPRALGVEDGSGGGDGGGAGDAPGGGPLAAGPRPLGSSIFAMPVAETLAGKTTPMMRQVALIASIRDEATLDEIERTGKLGSTHGVGAAEIASQVVGWCAAQALALAEASLAPEIVQSASISARTRMALRVAHNERANLIQWMAALREKHALPEALIEEATAKHKACLKKLKQAIKQASQGEAHALERERAAAAAVDVD